MPGNVLRDLLWWDGRMARYVGFLRAVNVGPRKVAMGRLREEVEALGYDDVSTYINSGNVVFTATGRREALEAALEKQLRPAFGFDVPTYVRSASELEKVVAAEPFGRVASGHTHLVAFLRTPPGAAEKKAIEALSNDTDTLEVHGRDVHWHIKGKTMDSTVKASAFAKACGGDDGTRRNTTMLAKLLTKL